MLSTPLHLRRSLRALRLDDRAAEALTRQRAYQEHKAKALAAPLAAVATEAHLRAYTASVRAQIERFHPLQPTDRVLEVGSGAHGLVFFLEHEGAIGVDPLADDYARLFPQWQHRAKTVQAHGEALPFEAESFDVVLCDNVVDHAESPEAIVRELVRVLAPGGLLYFTVHVHHPLYALASDAYGLARALKLPVVVGPFADHTVHLTLQEARSLFAGAPLRVLHESTGIEDAKREGRTLEPRHAGDRLKRLFYKNARYELIAERT